MDMGLTDSTHTRSGQSIVCLTWGPQAPCHCSPLDVDVFACFSTEEIYQKYGIELFRQSMVSPFGRVH